MEQRVNQILMSLLHSAMTGEPLTPEEKNRYTDEALPWLKKVSGIHDIAHLVAMGIEQNFPMTDETRQWVKQEVVRAMHRYGRLSGMTQSLCRVLEEEKIPFLPLKGAVIREYYPEPWMRTSCDTDILVHEEDLERAIHCLTERYGYTQSGKGSHDVTLTHKNGIHLELHYTLIEDGVASASSQVLNRVWQNASIREGKQFWHEMDDGMFYFYHIAHMAKHFENGGCGVRPVIDLWLLDRMENADTAGREALLEQGALTKFARAVQRLSRVWLEGEPHDESTLQMENFILRGGVYGTTENRVAVQQQQIGGAGKYAISRLFLPYEVIRFQYPILNRCPWLLPVMEVRRWLKLVFCGHAVSSFRELKQNSTISRDEAVKTRAFLDKIGL